MAAIPDWFSGELSRLENVKHDSKNSIRATCPACGGHTLSVAYREGKILMKCWKQCEASAILNGWGISFEHFFPPEERHRNRNQTPEQKAQWKREARLNALRRMEKVCDAALRFEIEKVRLYMAAESRDEDLTPFQQGEYQTAVDRICMAHGHRPWRPSSAVWHFSADIGALIKSHQLQANAHQCALVTAHSRTRADFEMEAIWAMRRSPFETIRRELDGQA